MFSAVDDGGRHGTAGKSPGFRRGCGGLAGDCHRARLGAVVEASNVRAAAASKCDPRADWGENF